MQNGKADAAIIEAGRPWLSCKWIWYLEHDFGVKHILLHHITCLPLSLSLSCYDWYVDMHKHTILIYSIWLYKHDIFYTGVYPWTNGPWDMQAYVEAELTAYGKIHKALGLDLSGDLEGSSLTVSWNPLSNCFVAGYMAVYRSVWRRARQLHLVKPLKPLWLFLETCYICYIQPRWPPGMIPSVAAASLQMRPAIRSGWKQVA